MAKPAPIQNDYPFPVVINPVDKGRETLTQFIDTRSNDNRYHYEIAQPVRWVQGISPGFVQEHDTDFVEMARIVDPQNTRCIVTVAAVTLPRECGPAEWLHIDQENRKEKIVRRHDTPTKSGSLPDVLSTRGSGKEEIIVRTRCYKNGSRLFRVCCECPLSDYDEQAELFFFVLQSFRITHPEECDLAESTETCQVSNGKAGLKFVRLASWNPSEIGAIATGYIGYALTSEVNSGDWTGDLRILYSPSSAGKTSQEVFLTYIESLKSSGIPVFDSRMENLPPGKKFVSARLVHPNLYGPSSKEIEAPFYLLEHTHGIVAIGIVSPSRDECPLWSAINMRALVIARDSLEFLPEKER